ncbi:DUF58 domain-containing protein [Pseudoduganella eburnea]|uniref:DUF58 domain-containing protein n=1 Tax=Massilia eburnea TaxID=1776165 RepID=A0A6L6QNV5_9BURK|nr:DUF58 domain-containing protein [Massilia eburnea]MTW13567.1 DUF58 domain-containing protein [Massilia eburnea]
MKPTRRMFHALLGLTALGVPASVWPQLQLPWQVLGGALLLAAGADALLARRRPALRAERQLAGVLPVGAWHDVRLTVHNEGAAPLQLDVFDDYPAGWELEGMPHATRLAPGAFSTIAYRVRPLERGDGEFGTPWLRIAGPLGLWQATHRIGPQQTAKVFPDVARLLGQALRATDRQAPTAGSLVKRQRGEGTDFRQLREYRRGDSLRSIDWKATARHRKPISREYQLERDQQVVFLLDTGRRMLARDGDTSHFDHALYAVLTLAFVAGKQGDAVGLMSFGVDNRWLPPAKGRIGLDRTLAGVYDLQPGEAAPDYLRAANDLLNRLGRRAFVVLVTNVRDEDDVALRQAVDLLSSRHLVMCASLRERALDAASTAPVNGFDDALRLAASEHYLQQRQEAIRRLGLRAGHLVDVAPEQLASALLNRYLDIKESGAL